MIIVFFTCGLDAMLPQVGRGRASIVGTRRLSLPSSGGRDNPSDSPRAQAAVFEEFNQTHEYNPGTPVSEHAIHSSYSFQEIFGRTLAFIQEQQKRPLEKVMMAAEYILGDLNVCVDQLIEIVAREDVFMNDLVYMSFVTAIALGVNHGEQPRRDMTDVSFHVIALINKIIEHSHIFENWSSWINLMSVLIPITKEKEFIEVLVFVASNILSLEERRLHKFFQRQDEGLLKMALRLLYTRQFGRDIDIIGSSAITKRVRDMALDARQRGELDLSGTIGYMGNDAASLDLLFPLLEQIYEVKIVGINLAANALKKVPSRLTSLSDLRVIDLSHNQLPYKSAKSFLKEVKKSFQVLRKIDLSNNGLTRVDRLSNFTMTLEGERVVYERAR